MDLAPLDIDRSFRSYEILFSQCSWDQILVRLFACFAALLAVGADETNPSLGADKWFRQYWNGFVVDDRIIELVRFTSYPAP